MEPRTTEEGTVIALIVLIRAVPGHLMEMLRKFRGSIPWSGELLETAGDLHRQREDSPSEGEAALILGEHPIVGEQASLDGSPSGCYKSLEPSDKSGSAMLPMGRSNWVFTSRISVRGIPEDFGGQKSFPLTTPPQAGTDYPFVNPRNWGLPTSFPPSFAHRGRGEFIPGDH